MADLAVAHTIRDQLGALTLRMIGARDFVGSDNSLSFKILGSRKVSHIRIELEPSDTYKVSFLRVNSRKAECKTVAEVDTVYVDSLHAVIESNTGLATRL